MRLPRRLSQKAGDAARLIILEFSFSGYSCVSAERARVHVCQIALHLHLEIFSVQPLLY